MNQRDLGPESFCGAGARFGSFFFAILGRGGGFEGAQQASGDGGYLVDSGEEGGFVALGGFVEAGNLADELERGRADFIVGHRRIEVEKSLDVSAHGRMPSGSVET